MARVLERRSIYTARLHAVVGETTRTDAGGGVVSTATLLPTVIRRVLSNQAEVVVIDGEGRRVGVIDREAIEHLELAGVPERDLTASDAMRPRP